MNKSWGSNAQNETAQYYAVYLKFAKRINLNYSYQKKCNCELMDMLISLTLNISAYIKTSHCTP